MPRMLRLIAVSGPLLWSGASLAAPYCLNVLGVPPQCIYVDPSLCQRDAGKQGGTCDPQAGPGFMAIGSGRYCLSTTPGVATCGYYNYEACNDEARRLKGACYFDPSKASGAPNPYAFSNGP